MKSDLAQLTAELDAIPEFAGKRLADVPGPPRALRYKWRSRFYRLADVSFFSVVFGMWLACAPENPVWFLNGLSVGVAIFTALFAESRARLMTRQLHRPAAEQLARDLLGITD